MNSGCDSTIVEKDEGSMLIHTHVWVTDAEVIFEYPYRFEMEEPDDEGNTLYGWRGENLTIILTLSDDTTHAFPHGDYIGITNAPYPYSATGNWCFWTNEHAGVTIEVDDCKATGVYWTVRFTYEDGVTKAEVSNVHLQYRNGDDGLICGF